MLARLERGPRHRCVGGGRREVEDDVDRVRAKELLDRQRLERELGRCLLARDASRSAQATISNESKAAAFTAYARLITPQPTIPTCAGDLMPALPTMPVTAA